MLRLLVWSVIMLLPIQQAHALSERSLCQLPSSRWGFKKIVDKEDLYARIQKYDTKQYFLEYIYAHDNNWDTKPKPTLPSYIEMMKYPPYTGTHLSTMTYVFDDTKEVRQQVKKTHIITESEKEDVVMLINLVIDDTQKANELFDELYAQYLDKVKTPEVWHHCTWSPVFAYVEYRGVYFQLLGTLAKDRERIISFYYQ